MAKQLNIDLNFTANTSAAEENLKSLQTTLGSIASTPIGTGISTELSTAVASARELQTHLNAAMNTSTGNLDLSRLSTSLSKSNTSLATLSNNLLGAGIKGEQAFMQIQMAIGNANIQLSKSQTLVSQFMTTLTNTARWQVASTMLHGIVEAFSSAVNYAQDLDESLNNIRIVTGYSANKMAVFTKEANEAAKALNTTTTEYTDASLIFYQQGLNDEEVKERTDIVIKLANVTGESVQTVSDQMTAIWNNFSDWGDQTLEEYADVMTKLGAYTASSTDEIAEGLEKFSAVSKTVGLSYNYAAAAITTLTAKTRQSADVSGTALKTIFSRMEGLKLGETLDDGTDLNKYTAAMAKVGVNVKDANGELKDMDVILDELGAQWNNLTKDQQVALAQTVGGIRQYNQFIGLMSNYDYFTELVDVAEDATGELNNQQRIYSDSWEAASDKAKAALQGIYNALIPTDEIIELTDELSMVLDDIGKIVEATGGLKTLLLFVSNIIISKLTPALTNALNIGVSKISTLNTGFQTFKAGASSATGIMGKLGAGIRATEFGASSSSMVTAQKDALTEAAKNKTNTGEFNQFIEGQQKINDLTERLQRYKTALTAEERKQLEIQLQQLQVLNKQTSEAEGQREMAQLKTESIIRESVSGLYAGAQGQSIDTFSLNESSDIGTKTSELEITNALCEKVGEIDLKEKAIIDNNYKIAELRTAGLTQYSETVAFEEKVLQAKGNQVTATQGIKDAVANMNADLQKSENVSQHVKDQFAEMTTKLQKDEVSLSTFVQWLQKINTLQSTTLNKLGVEEETTIEVRNAVQQETEAWMKKVGFVEMFNGQLGDAESKVTDLTTRGMSFGSVMSNAMNSLSQFAMTFSIVQSTMSTLQSDDMSFGEKLASGLIAFTMVGSTAINVINGIKTALASSVPVEAAAAATKKILADEEARKLISTQASSIAVDLNTGKITKQAAIEALSNTLKGQGLTETQAQVVAESLLNIARTNGIEVLTTKNIQETASNGLKTSGIAVNYALAASEYTLLTPLLIIAGILVGIVAIIALTIAKKNSLNETISNTNQKLLDESKEMQETINTTNELADSVSTLVDEYNELSDAGEDASSTLESMREKIPELIKSYEDLSTEVEKTADDGYDALNKLNSAITDMKVNYEIGVSTGDFSTYEESQEEAEEASAQIEYDNATKGITAGGNVGIIDTQISPTDWDGSKDTLDLHVGGFDWSGEETKANQIIRDTVDSEFVSPVGQAEATGTTLVVKQSDPSSWVKYYEQLVEAREKMEETMTASELDASDTYRELDKAISDGKDTYDSMSELIETQAEAANTLVTAAMEDGEFGEDWDEKIDSYSEYVKAKEEYIKLMKEKGVSEENAEAQWKTKDIYSTYGQGDTLSDLFTDNENGYTVTDDQITTFMENSEQQGEKYGVDFASGFVSAMQSGEKLNISSIINGLDESEKNNLLKLANDPEELMKLFGLTEDMIKQMGYASAEEFANSFKGELNTWTEESHNKSADSMGKTKAESYGIDGDTYEAYIKLLADENDELAENRDALNEVARANLRLDQGCKSLAKKWDDINEAMSSDDIEAQAAVLSTVNDALEDILNLDSDQFKLLPDNFAKDNWSLIQDVMNNVEGAVDTLRDKAGESILLELDGTVDANGNLKAGLQDLHNSIAEFDSEKFEVGVAIKQEDQAAFYQNCQAIIDQAGMTAEQAQAYFASMGYDVEFEEKTVTTPSTFTYQKGQWYNKSTGEYEDIDGYIKTTESKATGTAIKTITPNGSYGGGTEVKTTASKSSTTSSSSSSGSSKKQKNEHTKQKDVVDRYKEVTDAIEDNTRALEKANTAADRLYGTARLAKLKESNKLLKESANLYKKKAAEAKNYMATDKAALDKQAASMGMSFTYDEDGDITNYTQQMNALYAKLEAAEQHYNSLGADAQETYKEDTLDPLNEQIDLLKEYLDLYEESKDTYEEALDEAEAKFQEWQDNNYEQITYEAEIKIEVREEDLEILDYYMGKIEDDGYKVAESMALTMQSIDENRNIISDLNKEYQDLETAYANGEISQADYIEGLGNVQSSMLNELETIQDLDEQMREYYGNTLDFAMEEIEKYTTKIDNASSAASHFQTILELTGQSTNYKKLGEVLKAQYTLAASNQSIARVQKQIMEDELAKARQDYESNLSNPEADIEGLKKDLDEAQEAYDEANEQYLSSVETTLEAAQAVWENALLEQQQAYEDFITNGESFDYISSTFDRLSSVQDEYLTKTNQVYEVNKLLNQVTKEIDATSNTAAKNKLKNVSEELTKLKEKNQLTQLELEIAQAQLEVELAEIALQEAQSAKSQVRLTRDSEGNYGYTYTADQESVSEAEQKLAEAQNNLYNIGLEAYNENLQQYYAILEEEEQALIELYEDESLSIEEKEERATEIRQAYADKRLAIAENLHDSEMILQEYGILGAEEAFTFVESSGIKTEEEIEAGLDTLCEQTQSALETWEEAQKTATDEVTSEYGELETALNDLTADAKTAAETVITTLVPALKDTLNTALKDSTTYLTTYVSQLNTWINSIETIVTAIQKVKAEAAGIEEQENTPTTPTPSSDSGSGSGSDSGTTEQSADVIEGVAASIWMQGSDTSGWGTGATRAARFAEKGVSAAQDYINAHASNGDIYSAWNNKRSQLSKYYYGSFDTGGYTGEWGPEGKVALLHQKELVLNESDTENLLTSIELLRQLASAVDLNAASSSLGMLTAASIGNSDQILEQNVTITAEFPNATDHNEIEEAFKSLVNQASQYARRNK